MNVAELLAIPASMFPEAEILWFEGEPRTYGSLLDGVARTAGALQALGVKPGDRVAVMQTNTPEVIETMLAVASIGAVFVPLNYRARREELVHMLNVAAPRLLLVGDRYVELATDLTRRPSGALEGRSRERADELHVDVPMVVAIESQVQDLPHLKVLASGAEPITPFDVAEDELAVLMFTSGTTANAKAVMLAHDHLVNFVFGTTEPADGSDRGSVLLAAPIYHIAGLSATLAASFAGRRIVVMRQFDAGEWLRLVASERISHAFLVPTMLKRLLDHPAFPETDLSSLQVLSYGAAPMPLSVIRRAIEAFPPTVQFINAFGQTETASTVTMLGPEDHRLEGTPEVAERKLRRLGSVGRPLPDIELRILGEDGKPLPTGQVGEIALRTSRTMHGYYGQAEATDRVLRGGWLQTGDLGWIDEEGYLFLTGRKSDLIIRGGENIAPEEVELVLESHPDIEEAAVVGLPDEEWGERVAAVVVLRNGSGVAAGALAEYCGERLASFKKPEVIHVVEALPRNSMGKVLRTDLRAALKDLGA